MRGGHHRFVSRPLLHPVGGVDPDVANEVLAIAAQLPAKLLSRSRDERARQAKTVMASAGLNSALGRLGVKGS